MAPAPSAHAPVKRALHGMKHTHTRPLVARHAASKTLFPLVTGLLVPVLVPMARVSRTMGAHSLYQLVDDCIIVERYRR